MAGKIKPPEISLDGIAKLRAFAEDAGAPAAVRKRAEIVLLRAEGIGVEDIASRLGASMTSIVKWPRRFAADGINGLRDLPKHGVVLPEAAEPGPPEAVRAMHWF